MGSNGLATSIEMFRKGTSFTDWSDRLAYTFHANQVPVDRQKSHFMTICGPFLFSQLKLHYSKDELDKATYADIVSKLKQKLDKTEPDLVQRFRFSQRNQQPDESNEDFVQAVKMQAEFCGFGAFKNVAIMDRVLAGLLDGNLKENLLKEESLTLDKMDKFITTWNIAKQNVKALNNQPGESQLGQYSYFTPEQIHYIQKTTTQRQGSSRYGNYRQNDGLQGQNFPERRNNSRFQPYKNYNSDSQVYTNRRFNNQTQQQRYFHKSYDRRYPQTRISCDFCGKMGHSKQNCFKLDYFNRQFVNFMGESTADNYSCNEGGEIEYANAEMFNQIENFQDNNDQCMKIFTVLNTTYVKLDETQIEDQMWSEDKKTRWRLVARIVVLWTRRRSVSAGSAVWLAHRDQLKPHYQQQDERPNLMTPFEKSAPDAAVVDLDVEMLNLDEDMLGAGYGGSGLFRGFPEAATARFRSRK
ncbi:uncharacterized protein LOC128092713 [Culex pipiens pallens]|uniref:uncharacterized protein LOC128092713 n=1 Tax=Culex pipiens pallens TaxID=42434 RepID=UPI0022AA11D3|nr:uncharacterized protein LOC128092713 [Culex pipiens pallens]